MRFEDDFDEMSEACIRAGRLVTEHGSPGLQRAMQLVLFILGREIAERVASGNKNRARIRNVPNT